MLARLKGLPRSMLVPWYSTTPVKSRCITTRRRVHRVLTPEVDDRLGTICQRRPECRVLSAFVRVVCAHLFMGAHVIVSGMTQGEGHKNPTQALNGPQDIASTTTMLSIPQSFPETTWPRERRTGLHVAPLQQQAKPYLLLVCDGSSACADHGLRQLQDVDVVSVRLSIWQIQGRNKPTVGRHLPTVRRHRGKGHCQVLRQGNLESDQKK